MSGKPQALTLEEALMLAAERKWKVTFYGYPYSVLIEDDFGDDIAHEGNWPESFSNALGYPVVERDDAAELREHLIGVLNGAIIESEKDELLTVVVAAAAWNRATASVLAGGENEK